MSVAIEVRDAIVARLKVALGAKVSVFAYRGEFGRDDILRIAKTLPAVAVCCFGSPNADAATYQEPRATYSFGAYVMTKASASVASRLADPGDAAAVIEEVITREILTAGWTHDSLERATTRRSVNASGEKGPFGSGYGFFAITWEHVLTIPAETDSDTLDDLETVNVDIDFADLAPDGETLPDGVVDHTTRVTGLDV